MTTPSPEQHEEAFNKLIETIERYLDNHPLYHFRPIQIDSINVYIVLYGKYNLLNVETFHIGCNVKIDGEIVKQKYSLYHYNYTSIKAALTRIECLRDYRIYNGELECPDTYSRLKLEETILPYSEDECCVVCYENTSEITPCNHTICLKCREKCIVQDQPDCPVCRSIKGLLIYNNRSHLINNNESNLLKRAIQSEGIEYQIQPEDSDDEPEDSDDESDEADDDGSDTEIDADADAEEINGIWRRVQLTIDEHEDSEVDEIAEFLDNI